MSASFLDHMGDIEDPRVPGMVVYRLDEMLLTVLVGVLCRAEDFDEIEDVGGELLDWLRRILPFEHGIAPAQTLKRTLARLDPRQLEMAFAAWVKSLAGRIRGVIAIDGKTVRGSKQDAGGTGALHLVQAWAHEAGLVLAQRAVDTKSNEITAIPELLDMLALEGAIVTIDAMGTQKQIAAKIVSKKADYVLALKGNQATLHEDVKLFAAEQEARDFKDTTVSRHNTVDGDHGRIETRKYTAIHDVSWLKERHDWPGLTGVLIVESMRELADKTEQETRFYITSLSLPAERVGPMIRDHWTIENSLHWVMDMVFRDDECRVRTDNAPANFVTLKHIANNLIRTAPGKDSQRLKLMTAAWDDDFLASLVAP